VKHQRADFRLSSQRFDLQQHDLVIAGGDALVDRAFHPNRGAGNEKAPLAPDCQSIPEKRSPLLAASCRHAISCSALRKLMPRRCAGAGFRQVFELFCMQTDTNGGSNDTDVNELAAMPTG
jgi:hypothetical protein